MTTQTLYIADDGAEFRDAVECQKYEGTCVLTAEAMKALKPIPDSCAFANGELGYVQQTKEGFLSARKGVLEIAKRHVTHDWIDQCIASEFKHLSWPHRIISEYSELKCLNHALNRLQCIDDQFREWGQQFFRNNPAQASNQNEYQP